MPPAPSYCTPNRLPAGESLTDKALVVTSILSPMLNFPVTGIVVLVVVVEDVVELVVVIAA
jgi:hypothetical protein